MSIPGFGDAITLFDTSIRIFNFINDLRSAQDDLMGLASEAHALRISINAVTSDSCHQTLYTFISKDQGRDLKTIVRTCDQNLEDLNRFIASVAVLVEKKGRYDGTLSNFVRGKARPGAIWKKRKSWTGSLRRAFAKCWAAYRFSMADKQAFRDKLILPTQSINIFLTSMTHVGLVNMGRLIGPGGGTSNLPQTQQPLLLPPAAVPTNKRGQRNASHGSADDRLGDWEMIGSQIAFRKPGFTLKGSTLTPDLEAEVLLYAKHLASSGERFSYGFEKQRRHFKVTKTPVDKTPPKPRSSSRARSKSRQPSRGRSSLSLGKDSKGTFVRKKKTVVVPPISDSGTGTLVTLDDERSRRQPLALPAPDFVEIKPSEWESDSDVGPSSHNNSDSDGPGRGAPGGGGGGGGPRRGRRPSGPPESDGEPPPHRLDDNKHRMDNDESGFTGPRTSGPRRKRSRWEERATYRHSSVRDLEEQKRKVEERIQREQDEAISMLEQFEEPARTWRRTTLRHDTHLSETVKEDIDEFQDLADTMIYLGETYGVTVSPAGERPPVDNGAVDSDDEKVTYDPELSRVDKLKAETSMPSREEEATGRTRKPDPSYYVEASLRSRMRPEVESRYAHQGYLNPVYGSYAVPVPEEYLKYSSRPHEHYSHRRPSWSPARSEEGDFLDEQKTPRGTEEGPRRRQRRRSRSPPDGDREYYEREWYGPAPGRRYESGFDPSHRHAEFGPAVTVDLDPRDSHYRQRATYPSEHRRERPSFADDAGLEIHLGDGPRPSREKKRRPTDLHREREMDILQPGSDQVRLRRPVMRRTTRDEVPYVRETYEEHARRDEDEASAAGGDAGPSGAERRRKGQERSRYAVEVEVDEDEAETGRSKRRQHRPSANLGSETGGGMEERFYMGGGRGRGSESDDNGDDNVHPRIVR